MLRVETTSSSGDHDVGQRVREKTGTNREGMGERKRQRVRVTATGPFSSELYSGDEAGYRDVVWGAALALPCLLLRLQGSSCLSLIDLPEALKTLC